MKIGIIVAMDKELRLLLPLLEEEKKTDIEGYETYSGRLSGHDVCMLKCGIGKVNAALSCSALIRNFHPDLVINSGVAGGADASVHVLDVVLATEVAYHDVWCGPGTEWGAAHGCLALMPTDSNVLKAADSICTSARFHRGLICSGDIFVSKEEEIRTIKSHFPEALALDMESGAIAQVCSMANVPFSIIRVISDTPGQAENISQYENFWSDAPEETFHTLKAIVSKL